MDQKVILESLSKHMDALASLLNWFVATALAMTYAGVKRQKTVEALGLKIAARDAFAVAAVLTVFFQIGMLLLLMRLFSMLSVLGRAEFLEGFTRMAFHDWYLNPFSFFGGGVPSQVHSIISYFLFFLVMNLFTLPLATLPGIGSRFSHVILWVLLVTSLVTAIAVWGVHWISLKRLKDLDSNVYSAVATTFMWRTPVLLLVFPITKAVRDALHRFGDGAPRQAE